MPTDRKLNEFSWKLRDYIAAKSALMRVKKTGPRLRESGTSLEDHSNSGIMSGVCKGYATKQLISRGRCRKVTGCPKEIKSADGQVRLSSIYGRSAALE
jgi:hypothetical protein